MIKHWLAKLAVCAALLGGTTLTLAQDYDEGIDYQRISPPQPTASADKVEVVELFWYGCPHCHQLEPLLHEWLEKQPDHVEFVRLPALLNPNWELLTRAYITADLLGVVDDVHADLFDRIHVKRDRSLHSEDGLAAFFAEHGVEEQKFRETFHSFATMTRVNQSRLMSRRYGVNGVPTIIVNGKYRANASMAGGTHEGMLRVVDHLIEKEYEAMNPATADAQH
ncbi:MAG: thiol:disulfide interchange protein DsbA/DsbL [Gammaproteobacteria bacterium]